MKYTSQQIGQTIRDTGSELLGGLFKANVRPSDSQQISISAMTQDFKFSNNGTSNSGARFDDNVKTGNYTLGYTFRPSEIPLIDFGAKVYYSTTENRQTFVAPDADGVCGSRSSTRTRNDAAYSAGR